MQHKPVKMLLIEEGLLAPDEEPGIWGTTRRPGMGMIQDWLTFVDSVSEICRKEQLQRALHRWIPPRSETSVDYRYQ